MNGNVEGFGAVQKVPPIQMTSVMADTKRPFMRVKTRWNYVSPFIDVWKNYIKYRTYATILFLVALATIFTAPPLGVIALAGSVYYWQRREVPKHRLESKRTVMIGH